MTAAFDPELSPNRESKIPMYCSRHLREAGHPYPRTCPIHGINGCPEFPIPSQGMNLNDYAAQCHADNAKWWYDIHSGERLSRNKGELIALMHSELSECLEGVRKNLPDDKLPHRKMEEVELADTLIRIFDYAGAFGLDLQGAYQEKRAYNARRVDHTHAHRMSENGKKF